MLNVDDRTGFAREEITPDMYKIATSKAAEMGSLNNSIRQGKGNLVGFLGEEIAKKVLDAQSENTYQHDLIMEDGTVIEVKTKDRTVDPRLDFNVTVANFNTKQKTDFYCFVSVKRDNDVYTHGHVLGIIEKTDFFKKAKFYKKGELEPDSNPPFYFRADCYNIACSDLVRF
jgi:hypothetical protein